MKPYRVVLVAAFGQEQLDECGAGGALFVPFLKNVRRGFTNSAFAYFAHPAQPLFGCLIAGLVIGFLLFIHSRSFLLLLQLLDLLCLLLHELILGSQLRLQQLQRLLHRSLVAAGPGGPCVGF